MIDNNAALYIFGEVLFDCFPTGEQILGGAPFNVAWHLQAFGDQPKFISRVGQDIRGARVLQAMRNWKMDTGAVLVDEEYRTGQVDVTIEAGEPHYTIDAPSAYDFISSDQLPELTSLSEGIFYHGTLSLRKQGSRIAYETISRNKKLKIFLDVNLRAPWWQKEEVCDWLKRAHWVKMNLEELQLLGEKSAASIKEQMERLQTTYGIEQLIVTRGAEGTTIRTDAGALHSLVPEKALHLVDTVGAGDAFSAVYIHGLKAGWPVAENLQRAQQFASKVIGLRGATTTDSNFYQKFIAALPQ